MSCQFGRSRSSGRDRMNSTTTSVSRCRTREWRKPRAASWTCRTNAETQSGCRASSLEFRLPPHRQFGIVVTVPFLLVKPHFGCWRHDTRAELVPDITGRFGRFLSRQDRSTPGRTQAIISAFSSTIFPHSRRRTNRYRWHTAHKPVYTRIRLMRAAEINSILRNRTVATLVLPQ